MDRRRGLVLNTRAGLILNSANERPYGKTSVASIAALRERGLVRLRERRFDEAEVALREVVVADAGNAEAWGGLGDVCHATGRLDEACEAYRASLSLDSERFTPWWGLGCVQLRRREFALAAEALERALALRPQHAAAWHNLGKAWFGLGRIEDAVDAMRRSAGLDPTSQVPLLGIAVAIPGDPRADAGAIRAARRSWTACALARVAPAILPAPRVDTAPRRLRVGYLSAFFKNHNWMKPVWTLINRHDRERFDVILLSDNPRESIDRGYAEHPQDRFVALAGLGNVQAVARIAALDLDILVDLNGYSAPERFGVVAARPARRIVAWFNSFATSGLDAYDAVIADAVVAPPDAAAEFEEPLLRLPFCHLTFEVNHPVPEVAAPPALKRGHLTFGCLAQTYKLVPGVVHAFARILAACPGSRLLLKSTALHSVDTRAFVQREFAEHGVAPDSLILEGPVEHFRFLEAYAQIDLALETFPYGGGTTAMESLWQGVPVLTFPGDRWAARLSASLMRHAGLDEFVVADVEAFVQRAVALYHDPATPQRLAGLRASMRDRLRHSGLCDGAGFARAMDRAYESIVQAPAAAPNVMPTASASESSRS
jgi:predicted O-linked N-acetylglucosamine transferase (SPINDLY family)